MASWLRNRDAQKFWMGTIDNPGEAVKVIKDVSKGFYALAGIQVAVGVFLGVLGERQAPRLVILDAMAYAGLAFALSRFRSRTVAVILLLLSCAAVGTTVWNQLGYGSGGNNIVLSLIAFWIAIRGVQATFKLRRLSASGLRPVQ